MGSFFFALFGVILLCIVLSKEEAATQAYQSRVDEMKSRSDKWYARVNKGPLSNAAFHEKMLNDRDFYNKMFDDCNAILDTIPEMDGIHIIDSRHNDAERILEMMYNAKTGDISFLWFNGYVLVHDLAKGFHRKPTIEGYKALMKWYQRELRKNGYPGATILPIESRGEVLGWRFTDGAKDYNMIKHELYID